MEAWLSSPCSHFFTVLHVVVFMLKNAYFYKWLLISKSSYPAIRIKHSTNIFLLRYTWVVAWQFWEAASMCLVVTTTHLSCLTWLRCTTLALVRGAWPAAFPSPPSGMVVSVSSASSCPSCPVRLSRSTYPMQTTSTCTVTIATTRLFKSSTTSLTRTTAIGR